MSNIFKDLWTRIKIDYKEWREEWITRWNTRREMKQIDSAIRRAKERNARDHKTYYVIPDRRGVVDALTGKEIDSWAKRGLFPKMNIKQKCEKMICRVKGNNLIEHKAHNDIKNKNLKK